MRLKRKLSLAIILSLCLILIACGGGNQATNQQPSSTDTNSTQVEQKNSYNLTMTLAGTSGTFYTQGAALAEFINNNSTMIRTVPTSSGGGVENVRKIGNGQADIGLAFLSDLWNGWQGLDPFSEVYRDFRQLGPAQKHIGWNFIVLESSNINSVHDLIGQNFSSGAPGSGSADGTDLFLREIGLYDKINISYNAWGELPGMLTDGSIKGFSRTGGVPIPVAQEIDLTHPMKVLDLSKELEESDFFGKYPFYSPFTIPAGTYKGQKEDALTFAQPVVWIAHKDLPEEAVYEFMRIAYSEEAAKHLDNVYPDHDHRSENPLNDLIVPLHPGAEKYWQEQGFDLLPPLLENN